MPDLPGEVEQSRDHYFQCKLADFKFLLQEVVGLRPNSALPVDRNCVDDDVVWACRVSIRVPGRGKSSVDPVSDVDRHPEWDFFSCLKVLLYYAKLLPVRLFCVFYRIVVNGVILVKVLFCLLDLLSFYLARMHTGVKDKYLGVPGFEGDEVWLEMLKLLRLTP